jgi:hypothetical protein
MIHRNQEQIDLLTANNTQLIEFLMVAGAQDALTSLTRGRAVDRTMTVARTEDWPETLPALPVPKKLGRPAGGKNKPRVQAKPEQRYDSIGRRINRATWTPERRAMMARLVKARAAKKEKAASAAKSQRGSNSHDRSPQAIAEWKRKLSEASRRARARKAALGIDYQTNKPLAKEVKA